MGAVLIGANLQNANLTGANTAEIQLLGANLDGARQADGRPFGEIASRDSKKRWWRFWE
jgi:uncharacterized protein YjbI with pentapeptide repeats